MALIIISNKETSDIVGKLPYQTGDLISYDDKSEAMKEINACAEWAVRQWCDDEKLSFDSIVWDLVMPY